MRKLLCLATIFLASLCHADTVVVVKGQRLTNRVVFVCDISGSMNDPVSTAPNAPVKLDVLAAEVERITALLGDEASVQFVAFGAYPVAYTPTWFHLPDEDGVKAVRLWLRQTHDSDIQGATNIVPPLRIALANPQADLSILILSDAEWGDAAEIDAIARMNAARANGPCPIAIEGIGTSDGEDTEAAKKVATASRSYFLKIK
jgi:hypothetical protein